MAAEAAATTAIGELLREWRTARNRSQLDLALEAGVSARHLSFLETGRSNPSREMVLRLAATLEVPLRQRNALLEAAGFAPVYRETGLSDPEMEHVRRVLEMLLERHEPYSAVVIDRRWNVVLSNRPHERLLDLLLAERAVPDETRGNLLRLLFEPAAIRPHVANWEEVARAVLGRLHRQVARRGDEASRALLEEVVSFPDVPERWNLPDLDPLPRIVVPIRLRVDDLELRLFTTITTLGAPEDVTLEELQMESFLPADAETADALERLHRATDPGER